MVVRTNEEERNQEANTGLLGSRKCAYVFPDGARCKGNPCLGSPFCWWHNPQVTDRRRDAQSRGGRGRQVKRQTVGQYQVESPHDLLEPLIASLNESFALPNSAAKGRTIANLAGMVLKSLETANLEKRISTLEERTKAVDGKR